MKVSRSSERGRNRVRSTSAELTLDIDVKDAMPSLAVYLSRSAKPERLTAASTELAGQAIRAALTILSVPHVIE